MVRHKVLLLLFAAFLVATCASSPAQAQSCSMCKTGLIASEEGKSLVPSVRIAILILQVPMLMLLGTIAVFIIRADRRKRTLSPRN